MEGDGLVLYQALNIITINQLRMSSKVKEDIQRVVSNDSTKTTKDIMKGLGIGYVPAEASAPAANADHVRKERKMALGKFTSVHKELRPLGFFVLTKFERKWKANSCTMTARISVNK
jgi:hypothetical protein